MTDTVTSTVAAGTPVLVTSQTKPPAGYRLNANQVLAIASRSPVVKAELRHHRHAVSYEYTKGFPEWQVSWFSDQKPARELIQVYVDDTDRQGDPELDGLSGRLDDGARLSRRVRPQRQRLVHLDPDVHLSLWRRSFPGAGGRRCCIWIC